MPLPPELLDLSLWDRLDTPAAERVAQSLEKRLPPPWRLAGVRECRAAGQSRPVPFFDWNGAEFALIPAGPGPVLLGYDPSFPPDLTDQDLADWQRAEYEYGILDEHLRATLTPLRQVVLAPFLMEVTSREMDTEPNWISGRRVGTRTVSITNRQVRDWATADGFCLPTSDQWEHACRAGSRTFWWWGNALSFPVPDRNAFGLDIACDTYCPEWCTSPDVYRGGDGGSACHGGLDGLPTTLRLASAYFEPFPDAATDSAQFTGHARRIFPLPSD